MYRIKICKHCDISRTKNIYSWTALSRFDHRILSENFEDFLITVNSLSPLKLNASLRRSNTSANFRTSLTSCMMYSGSELIELRESLLIKPDIEARELDSDPGGKKCELESRVMPIFERLFPRLLCCSIPLENIPAAASSLWTSETANSLRFNQIPHTSSAAVAVPANRTDITNTHIVVRAKSGQIAALLKTKLCLVSCEQHYRYKNDSRNQRVRMQF